MPWLRAKGAYPCSPVRRGRCSCRGASRLVALCHGARCITPRKNYTPRCGAHLALTCSPLFNACAPAADATRRQPPGRNTRGCTHDRCIDTYVPRSAGSLTSPCIVPCMYRRAPDCNFTSYRRADFRLFTDAEDEECFFFQFFFPLLLNAKQLHFGFK